MRAMIHPSAIVEEGFELRDGVKIWHFCHVRAGALIGRGSSIGQGCYIAPTAKVGERCKIQNHVSIYDGVELGDEVFIGPNAVFTNVLTPRAHVSRRGEYATTRIASRASIGANATIVCGVEIGAYALVGAGSVVTRDVPAHALVVGNPARQIGWSCTCGVTLESHHAHHASITHICPDCQAHYQRLDAQTLIALPGDANP